MDRTSSHTAPGLDLLSGAERERKTDTDTGKLGSCSLGSVMEKQTPGSEFVTWSSIELVLPHTDE